MLLDAPPSRQIPSSPQPESSGAGDTPCGRACILQHPAAPHSSLLTLQSAQGAKQVPMDPSIRDTGLCQPLASLTWLSKAHGLHSHSSMMELLLWVGLVSLKFCVCWGKEEGTHRRHLVPHRQKKDAMLVFKLGKIFKGGMSMESQQVSAASNSVPVRGAGPGKAHHTRDLVTSCFTVYRRSVLSSRCQWQTTHPTPPTPCHPSWLGQALPSFPFPDFIVSDRGVVEAPKEFILQSKLRCKSMSSTFWKGRFPVFPWVTWCLTVHCWTIWMSMMTWLCFPKAAVLSSEVIRWSLTKKGNATPGCALWCYSRIFQQQRAKEVQEKEKVIQQLPVLVYMKQTFY